MGRKRHAISPVTASEIRKILRISKKEMRNVLRAFKKSGVDV
jgi:DNA-binding transcriptional regulator GbsR (MarR family)